AATPHRTNRPRAATHDAGHPRGERHENESAKRVKPAEVTALHLALLSRDLIPWRRRHSGISRVQRPLPTEGCALMFTHTMAVTFRSGSRNRVGCRAAASRGRGRRRAAKFAIIEPNAFDTGILM